MNNSESKGITKISISGFKSIANECSIDIRPLTILAGANSSGKSSIMQPLLLMKQTLESPYSYAGLSLNGENIRFTSAKQILSRFSKANQQDIFTVQIDIDINRFCRLKFQNIPEGGLQTVETSYSFEDYLQHLVKTFNKVTLSPEMTREEIIKALPPEITRLYEIQKKGSLNYKITNFYYYLICTVPEIGFPIYNPTSAFSTEISEIIHVKGMRNNLERTYKLLAFDSNHPHYSGAFDNYIGSLISYWSKKNTAKLEALNDTLAFLNLVKKVEAENLNDTQIELRVTRSNDSEDMVNIVDVGSGVSQILPVLVALVAAEPEQLVYLEEPEIHLHPRAQANLGEIIVDAANRGVRVVLETHSDLLLRRIQSLVAEDKISADKAILHWFSRDEHGFTQVTSTPLNATGGYGDPDFPLDFSDVFLDEEGRYLEAASEKRWKEQNEY
jgi:predicted ATPase